jgi:hypothetical protein
LEYFSDHLAKRTERFESQVPEGRCDVYFGIWGSREICVGISKNPLELKICGKFRITPMRSDMKFRSDGILRDRPTK